MDKTLQKAFWSCGDSLTIDFAMMRARLNRQEKEVLRYMLDDCRTQEQTAELMDISTRQVQKLWKSAADKLLIIPWVKLYAYKGGALHAYIFQSESTWFQEW